MNQDFSKPFFRFVCSSLSFALWIQFTASNLNAQDVIAIRDATVRTLSKEGTLSNATILLRDGKIAEVGKNVEIPISARVIDGKGKTITPSFVSIFYPMIPKGDTSSEGSRVISIQGRTFVIGGRSPAANTSFVKVADTLSKDSVDWKAPLRAGVTTMNLVTAGYSQAAVVTPLSDGQATKVIEPNGRVVVTITNSTQSLDLLRNNLKAPTRATPPSIPPAMAAMMAARGIRPPSTPPGQPPSPSPAGAGANAPSSPAPEPTPEQKLWNEVRDGNAPLFMNVNNSATILHALEVLKEYPKVKAVWVVNGPDAFQALEEFPKDSTKLVLPTLIDIVPNSRNRMNVPAIASKRKIPFVFSYGPRAEETQIAPTFALAMLSKTGLSEDETLRAVTLGPAEFLGLEKTIGSIEVGKLANLILFDGSPFEATTTIQNVFLEGRTIHED